MPSAVSKLSEHRSVVRAGPPFSLKHCLPVHPHLYKQPCTTVACFLPLGSTLVFFLATPQRTTVPSSQTIFKKMTEDSGSVCQMSFPSCGIEPCQGKRDLRWMGQLAEWAGRKVYVFQDVKHVFCVDVKLVFPSAPAPASTHLCSSLPVCVLATPASRPIRPNAFRHGSPKNPSKACLLLSEAQRGSRRRPPPDFWCQLCHSVRIHCTFCPSSELSF